MLLLQDEKKNRVSHGAEFFSVSNILSVRDMYDKRINVPCDVRVWIKKKEERKKGKEEER